jgi:hypothetical protein
MHSKIIGDSDTPKFETQRHKVHREYFTTKSLCSLCLCVLSFCIFFTIPIIALAEEATPGRFMRENAFFQWEIIAGNLYPAKIAQAPARTIENETKTEILQLNGMSEKALSVQYSYFHAAMKLNWTLSWNAEKMQFIMQDANLTVEYLQEKNKSCICKYSKQNQKSELITADSLWHMAMLYPEFFDSILRPRLDLLRSGWNLSTQVQELRSQVFECVQQDWPAERKKWQKAVLELSHSQFARREAASQQLKQGGWPAIVFLQNFASTTKDPEQLQRIAKISREGQPIRDNTQTIAAGMVYDVPLWLEFLQSPQLETRQIAIKHLSQLLERPLIFDIQAPAVERQMAWESLKKSLLKK